MTRQLKTQKILKDSIVLIQVRGASITITIDAKIQIDNFSPEAYLVKVCNVFATQLRGAKVNMKLRQAMIT